MTFPIFYFHLTYTIEFKVQCCMVLLYLFKPWSIHVPTPELIMTQENAMVWLARTGPLVWLHLNHLDQERELWAFKGKEEMARQRMGNINSHPLPWPSQWPGTSRSRQSVRQSCHHIPLPAPAGTWGVDSRDFSKELSHCLLFSGTGGSNRVWQHPSSILRVKSQREEEETNPSEVIWEHTPMPNYRIAIERATRILRRASWGLLCPL